jgi:4-hydroxy-tetrahydrodipicolinate reductase
MAYRVVQWGADEVAHHAVRAIADHADLELVGVCNVDVHTMDQLIGLIPDCVCYTAVSERGPAATLNHLSQVLSSGASVVTAPLTGLVDQADVKLFVSFLDRAADDGASSFFTAGDERGLLHDLAPADAAAPAYPRQTALRMVAAIPAVCRGRPGLLTAEDVPAVAEG